MSDIYSLGCTLYYAVCGKVPFPGGDTNSKLKRHLEQTPLHPCNFAPDLSEEFIEIIAEMMEKDSIKRIQSAAEVAARLEPWAGDAGSLTSSRLSRGPWQAPPPTQSYPMDNAEGSMESSHYQETSNAQSEAHSVSSTVASLSRSEVKPPPVCYVPMEEPLVVSYPTRKSPTPMVIALTVAIMLPPALLIGAFWVFSPFNYLP
ncbi:MAG: hypothetical protein U0905_22110 [Pirellulales bacterium]